jgi:chaperonin GroES
MRTLSDILAVQRLDPAAMTDSGRLWIPDLVRDNIEKGIYFGYVKHIGPKVRDVSVGDKVMFSRWENEPWESGIKYCGMHERDVMGIMSPSLHPLSDHLLLEPLKPEPISKGGIIIPDNAQDRPLRARVLAVGPGLWENGCRTPMEVSPGAIVLYGKLAGTEITLEEKQYRIIREKDILAVESDA